MSEHIEKPKISSLKLMLITSGVILVTVLIGMVFIRNKDVETDITARTTRVGLIINGPKDDKSFCQTHYDALLRIKDELNLEILCRENVPEEEAEYTKVMEELIEDEGCRIIIGASYRYSMTEIAARFPEVCFLHIFGIEELSNLSSANGRMYQARYLSGIAAGMRSKTGKIGYVAAFPVSEVISQINAFTLGVKSVVPDAKVYVRYCGSWVDDEGAGAVTGKLLSAHPDIDVLSMHTNSIEPNRIAEENGVWSIGFNMDNRELFPETYLTACEWRWDTYYKDTILSYLHGKFNGEIVWPGMESGIFGLSELTGNAVPGTKEAVDSAVERFLSRRYDVFYGPVWDNEGSLRIPEGESMPDSEILNHFDWYVEGIEVEE